MSTSEERQRSGRRYLIGGLIAAVFYLVLMIFLLVVMICDSPKGWLQHLTANPAQTLMLVISALLLFSIVYVYNVFENKPLFEKRSSVALLYLILILSVAVCYLFGAYVSVYARPVALLAFLCVFLFDRRQAILLNFVFAMLMFTVDIYFEGFMISEQSETFFSLIVSFVCNPFAVFMAGNARTRGRLLLSGCIIAVPTVVVALLLCIPNGYSDWVTLLRAVGFSALGCLISSVLALALLPVLEWLFNRLTVFRLRELTSTNAPVLVRLKTEAPGTFNHSLIVAQLSESCAVAIGENAELARAAAYYHDVGKLKQPDCFTENQSDYNVHDELMPELSADIIRSHARDGYDLLTASHLPQIIADVAMQHHGTLPIKYFYAKAMRLSGSDVDIKDYSYLGPKPQSKIAAIVMIADAAEAICRSVPDRSPEKLEQLIRGLIEERMDLGQFEDCDITMRELSVIRRTLVESLSGVHHRRVEYPAIRFRRESGSADEVKATNDANNS